MNCKIIDTYLTNNQFGQLYVSNQFGLSHRATNKKLMQGSTCAVVHFGCLVQFWTKYVS